MRVLTARFVLGAGLVASMCLMTDPAQAGPFRRARAVYYDTAPVYYGQPYAGAYGYAQPVYGQPLAYGNAPSGCCPQSTSSYGQPMYYPSPTSGYAQPMPGVSPGYTAGYTPGTTPGGGGGTVPGALPSRGDATPGHDAAAHATPSAAEFRRDMRKLWEDHITWTRLYIVSALADLPDKEAASKRLLKNQSDIGDAVKPFFGDEAGTKLTALLKDHILISVDVVDAAKAGDDAKKEAAVKRWQANADDIASFLSKANPKNWPEAEMKSMMRDHLDLTTAEVVARLKKDWTGDAEAYDKVHRQILHMADMLSDGIIKQFPDKFRN